MKVKTAAAPPWRIGWFGALRCRRSLELLAESSRRLDGRFEVVLRGRPALVRISGFPRFRRGANRSSRSGALPQPGGYRGDLQEVHFSWAIDFFEEGQNSEWLLPNRLYEGCRFGAVPISMGSTETGRFLNRQDIGILLSQATTEAIEAALGKMEEDRFRKLKARVLARNPRTWSYDRSDCRAFVEQARAVWRQRPVPLQPKRWLERLRDGAGTDDANGNAPIEPDRDSVPERGRPYRCAARAVAAGGRTARRPHRRRGWRQHRRHVGHRRGDRRNGSAGHPSPQPKAHPERRDQSRRQQFGNTAEYLIRIDAHGGYPPDYCDRLVEEALATGADSVVVSMLTSGNGALQKAVAAAQNSKLGTGGSKHRHHSAGEWVDHGHHALMRISAFKAVGGYDETFSHNEDAELDYRLRQAGYRIWMSGRTQMVYYPRSSLKGLYSQYLGYGRGRAKNVLKHRMMPKVRQMMPLLVFPVVLLAAFSFVHWVAAMPFWCGSRYASAMAYGWRSASAIPTSRCRRSRRWSCISAGPLGFWLQLLGSRWQRKVASCAGLQKTAASTSASALSAGPSWPTRCARSAARHAFGFNRRDRRRQRREPSARALVAVLAEELKLPIRYLHSPARNISIARNACLDNSTSAISWPSSTTMRRHQGGGWSNWSKAVRQSGAEAVLGPVRAVYSDAAPGWMRRGDFHSTLPVWVARDIRTGYSCNVILRRATTPPGRRFSLASGQTGGEDTEYFTEMDEAGGKIAYAPRARVDEPVPEARGRFAWLGHRRFQCGQTHGQLLGRRRERRPACWASRPRLGKGGLLFRGGSRDCRGPVRRNRSVLRGIMHVGVVSGLVGVREIRLYGLSSPRERNKHAA